MKIVKYILLLLFIFSCSSKDATLNKNQINQNKQQVGQNKIKMQKRIPVNNRTLINKVNNQNIEETLQRIDELERAEVLKATQSYRGLEANVRPSSLNYSDAKAKEIPDKKVIEDDFIPNPQVASTQKQNTNQTKRVIEDDFIPNPQVASTQKQSISMQNQNDNPPILEISGMQNKPKQYNVEQSPKQMFALSTSASYRAEDLESVSAILSQFGDVKFHKIGDTFSLKIHPKTPLTTQNQANELLKEVIRYPFFDIYVEELK